MVQVYYVSLTLDSVEVKEVLVMVGRKRKETEEMAVKRVETSMEAEHLAPMELLIKEATWEVKCAEKISRLDL